MIGLSDYRAYWEDVCRRLSAPTTLLPVTIDKEMGRRIQALPADVTHLFMFPPLAESNSRNIDNYTEVSRCVVFVMKRYNPQKRDAFSVLEETHSAIREIKSALLSDQYGGTTSFVIDVASIETAPETELYGTFAGWSLGFNIIDSHG